MAGTFRLIEVARAVVDEIDDLLDRPPRRLLHDRQLREAADSITANIREAYGRGSGPERNQFFRYARGSAEETSEHLRTNFATRRILPPRYWRIHNRLIVIRRMLTTLMGGQ